jgi:hypothetical protein
MFEPTSFYVVLRSVVALSFIQYSVIRDTLSSFDCLLHSAMWDTLLHTTSFIVSYHFAQFCNYFTVFNIPVSDNFLWEKSVELSIQRVGMGYAQALQ